MITDPSRKRGGDKSSEVPPSKVSVVDPSVALHDVVLIVKGQKFYCLKEKLAEHSTYFERMFFSEFAEKNKMEVDIGEVEPDVFQLFIDAVNGIDSMSDEYSEVALVAAIYLGSSTLEETVLKHLAGNSEISLQEQFKMAEDHKSNKLMIQVCASIKDAKELDEVVPKDLDSFCNTTKNLVMQRSFELLGIRKPPSPPLPEDPDQVFEHMMNQLIDQVEVQNHHGDMLQLQAELLVEELKIEQYLSIADRDAGSIIRADPLIKELTGQFQDVHEQSERSFIQAQIQVLKWKIIYERLQNREYFVTETVRASFMRSIPLTLSAFSKFLNRDKRSQIRSQKVTSGDREIDEMYRRIIAGAIERIQSERPRNVNKSAVWLQGISQQNNILERFPRDIRILDQRPRPDNLRVVSNQASFRLIDEFVNNARNVYYTTVRKNQPDHNEAVEAQNPREQDQEGN